MAGDALTTGNYNVAIGTDTLGADTKGSRTTALGYAALNSQNFTTASNTYNTAVGFQAGLNVTTGSQNTFVGGEAGEAITTGNYNNYFGYNAGTSTTIGDHNVGLGRSALSSNVAGNKSIAIGDNALGNQTSGTSADMYNVAIGHHSGINVTSGVTNTFVGGNSAAGSTLTGSNNTCVGYASGHALTSGSNNLCLGHDAGRATSPSGNITIGSDTICLGDNDINDLFCADTSISSSDSRDKTDVTNFTGGLDWVKALRPVTYKWDKRSWYGNDDNPMGTPDGSKKRNRLHVGFLAQEVLAIEQDHGFADTNDTSLVVRNNLDGNSYGLKYERLVPVLVNAIKELSTKITTLEDEITKLKGE